MGWLVVSYGLFYVKATLATGLAGSYSIRGRYIQRYCDCRVTPRRLI